MSHLLPFLSWDNLAVALALIAVVLRLCDRPKESGMASSGSVLAATIGQWRAHRKITVRPVEKSP